MTSVIIAVTDENDCPSDGIALCRLQQLFAAGVIDRIIESGRVTGSQRPYPLRQTLCTVCEVLSHFQAAIEAQHEGFIKMRSKCLVQKFNRRLLLELETLTDRAAGVNQQADLKRQIGLPPETVHLLNGLLVIYDFEVALSKVLHVFVVPVSYGEHYVDFVDLLGNGGGAAI